MENVEIKTNGAVTVTDDYAVVVANKEGLQAFFAEQKNLETLYAAVEKKALGLVADVSTKEGRSQIKSAARQLASVKTKVDDLGKKVVANLKELPKVIDANRKTFREKMEALQDEIRRPVTEIEERQKRLEEIAGIHLNLSMADSATLEAEIRKLETVPLTDEEWKESVNDAIMTVGGEINALKLLLETALKCEQETRELEELRMKQAEAERIIREQKIREEAERKAKEEAEARAAAEKARLEREKAEAERMASEAEMARQEAERKAKEAELAARNVPNPVQAAALGAQHAVTPMSKTLPTPKPSKWTPEMKAVNNAIVNDIAEIIKERIQGFTPSGYTLAAQEIVKAIVNGKIRNLKVEY